MGLTRTSLPLSEALTVTCGKTKINSEASPRMVTFQEDVTFGQFWLYPWCQCMFHYVCVLTVSLMSVYVSLCLCVDSILDVSVCFIMSVCWQYPWCQCMFHYVCVLTVSLMSVYVSLCLCVDSILDVSVCFIMSVCWQYPRLDVSVCFIMSVCWQYPWCQCMFHYVCVLTVSLMSVYVSLCLCVDSILDVSVCFIVSVCWQTSNEVGYYFSYGCRRPWTIPLEAGSWSQTLPKHLPGQTMCHQGEIQQSLPPPDPR